MIRYASSAFAALLLAGVPASATTYTGTLYGTITTGSAEYDDYSQFDPDTGYKMVHIDLGGTPIEVDFTADVTANYYSPSEDMVYPKYVVTGVTVTLDATTPLGAVGSSQMNTLNHPDGSTNYGYSDYTGNAHAGTFHSSGPIYGNEPDFSQTVDFSFANAGTVLGALTGSGTAAADFYIQSGDSNYSVSYTLSSGFVTATGAPEPAGWALLIGGFGAIGAVLRRRPRVALPALV